MEGHNVLTGSMAFFPCYTSVHLNYRHFVTNSFYIVDYQLL